MIFGNSSEMEPEPLLFLDSGVGGLPYLALTRQRLPGEHYVYLADRSNYPYGEKPAAELRRRVVATVGEALGRFRPKLVGDNFLNTSQLILLFDENE